MKKSFLILIFWGIHSLLFAQHPYQSKADSLGVFLIAPTKIDTSACESIWFLKTGSDKLNPNPLKIVEAQKLYFEGMYPQAKSKKLFNEALSRCVIPSWAASAPCAVTTSQILEEAAIKAGNKRVETIFKDETKYGPTHNVEIQMRNLGWHYYLKTKYVAPCGAIGMWSRYTWNGWPQHSGHIYTIVIDKGPDGRQDTIADNAGWGHLYTPSGICEGFWLPQGVYPKLRNPSAGPKLLSPADGSGGASFSPTLRWNAYSGATSYLIQVATDGNFTNIVYQNNSITSTSIKLNGLTANTTYFWRVKANNNQNYSEISRFITTAPIMQTIWNKNAPNQPSWFSTSANSERGLAFANDKIYVVSRSSGTPTVKIISATNGNDISSLNTPTSIITGGTYALNDIETSSDGKIFACNLTIDAKNSPFKIYFWDNDNANPTVLINYACPNKLRMGDNFSVTGSFANKNIVIYAASPDSNLIFKWSQKTDGTFSSTPQIITLSDMRAKDDLGSCVTVAPSAWNVNEYLFVISKGINFIRVYNTSGTLVGEILTPIVPTEASSLKTFAAGGKKYIALFLSKNDANDNCSQSACVIDITNGVSKAVQYAITPSQYVNSNVNRTGDISVKVNSNGSFNIYVLSTNNGIAAYSSQTTTDIAFEEEIQPVNFTLHQNYPNPFNPTTYITYELPYTTNVILTVFDMLGREIATLVNETQNAGSYSVIFDANNYGLSSGVYFYMLQAGNYKETKKMVLNK